jgi:hypothetical protein
VPTVLDFEFSVLVSVLVRHPQQLCASKECIGVIGLNERNLQDMFEERGDEPTD